MRQMSVASLPAWSAHPVATLAQAERTFHFDPVCIILVLLLPVQLEHGQDKPGFGRCRGAAFIHEAVQVLYLPG